MIPPVPSGRSRTQDSIGANSGDPSSQRVPNGLKDRVPDIKGQPYSRFAIEVFEKRAGCARSVCLEGLSPPDKLDLQPHMESNADNPGGSNSNIDILIPISPGQMYSWNGE